MTVGTTPPKAEYVEDAVTLVHAIPFQFFLQDELTVTRTDPPNDDGSPLSDANTQTLTLGADYTVAGGNGDVGSITKTSTGTVGATITILRHTHRSQLADYEPLDDFPAEKHEEGLDRLEMQIQELEAAQLTAEDVRDILAKVLVAGPGIAIQVNDALNTITISALDALDFPDCLMLSGDQQAWEGVGDPAGAGGLSEEDVEDIVASMIVPAGGLSKVYDDAAGTLTLDASGVLAASGGGGLNLEAVQDAVAAMISATGGLTVTYNDGAGTLEFDASGVGGGGGGGGGLSVTSEDLTAGGHVTLSDGLTLQWGTLNVPGNGTPTIFFDVPYTVFSNVVGSGGHSTVGESYNCRVLSTALDSFAAINNDPAAVNFWWFAIGK